MPVIVPILAAQAIAHGLRIAGLRILPYIIRSKTAKSAAQYATKKVGQKSITDTGYVVITNDPTKFKLAQRIFGKNKVFWMIVVFTAISLALSEWGWRNSATANFYLTIDIKLYNTTIIFRFHFVYFLLKH